MISQSSAAPILPASGQGVDMDHIQHESRRLLYSLLEADGSAREWLLSRLNTDEAGMTALFAMVESEGQTCVVVEFFAGLDTSDGETDHAQNLSYAAPLIAWLGGLESGLNSRPSPFGREPATLLDYGCVRISACDSDPILFGTLIITPDNAVPWRVAGPGAACANAACSAAVTLYVMLTTGTSWTEIEGEDRLLSFDRASCALAPAVREEEPITGINLPLPVAAVVPKPSLRQLMSAVFRNRPVKVRVRFAPPRRDDALPAFPG